MTIRRLCVFLSLSLALWTIVGVASPAQATTVNYYLPYTAGFTAVMTQGPGGSTSHTGTNAHAYDFDLNGGAVRASASGTIISKVANQTSQTGPGNSGNYVVLKHADNTCTSYAHMAHGSVTAKNVGDTVAQAEQIGNEGNTGYTLPVGGGHHLHFQRDNCSWNSTPVDFVENNWTSQNSGDAAPSPSPGRNLIKNASFGGGTSSWTTASGGNFAVYTTGGPQSGVAYAATNGGGIYQDVPLAISQNQAFCATAEVRAAEGGTGASGIMKIWQLGGSYNDGEDVHFTLGSTWEQIKVCGVATTSHSSLRLQFYPAAGSPTIDIDDVNMHQSLANNASFGGSTAGWTVSPGANFTTYAGGSTPPQSGVRYAATNGGGFYQDIPLTITPNQAFCATAEVRTGNGSSGASGILKLWQLGGSYNDGEQINFSSLTSSWKQIKVCGVATTAHTTLRVQFYTTSGHTLDVDDVDVHRSLANNASFGSGTVPWTAATGGNFAVYTTGGPQSGVAYGATNGAGVYQDISLATAVNDTVCVTAEVRTASGQSGAAGILKIWQLGGSYNDGEDVHFGPLGSTWEQIKVCGVATTAHAFIRVQFYPTANTPTLDIDDVDVH